MPFVYLKRVFNIFPSRGLPDLTVIDGVGERNGCILVCRFPRGSEHIKYSPLRPLYKEEKQEFLLPQMNPFIPTQNLKHPDSFRRLFLLSGYTLT